MTNDNNDSTFADQDPIDDGTDIENTEHAGDDASIDGQYEDEQASSGHAGLWIAVGVAVIGALVFWWVWRNKREQLARAAAQLNRNIQTSARSGAEQAQDLLDTAWSRASDASGTALRNVAQSAPAQHAQEAVVNAPVALADSLEQISRKLRDQVGD